MHAGIGAVQVREKDLEGGALLARVTRVLSLCGPRGPRVLVNDRADVACAAGAHGVHLPAAGMSVENARRVVGSTALVGRSVHRREELSLARGADYVIFGPIFETPSKRRYGEPQGLARLAAVARAAEVPVIAIGGITVERVGAVLAHGAGGIAVMGAILDADDPARMVEALARAIRRARRLE